MIKKALVLTAIGVFVVFGVIGGILLIGNGAVLGGTGTRTPGNVLSVNFVDGFTSTGRPVSRDVRLVSVNDVLETPDEAGDDAVRLPLTAAELGFTRAGWNFIGWSKGHTSTTIIQYVPGGITRDCPRPVFVARWETIPFTITFNTNGSGLTAPGNIYNVRIGNAINIPTVAPFTPNVSRNGNMVFQGWRTRPNGGGQIIHNGAISTFTSHVTLYEWWVQDVPANNRRVNIESRTACGRQGPFSFYQVLLMGTILEFWYTDYSNATLTNQGYTFDRLRVGNNTFTRADLRTVNTIDMWVFILESNFTITFYYNFTGSSNNNNNNQTQNFTVTGRMTDTAGNAGPYTGTFTLSPQGGFNNGHILWLDLQNSNGLAGWDTYAGWSFVRVDIVVNGQVTSSVQRSQFTNNQGGRIQSAGITINANMTLVFVYSRT